MTFEGSLVLTDLPFFKVAYRGITTAFGSFESLNFNDFFLVNYFFKVVKSFYC